MFLDLDGFKPVNDTLGHHAGDKLLLEVARRLTRSVRSSDTVARFGGDEFVVMLPSVVGREDTARIAQKVLQTFSAPFALEGRKVSVSVSIGVSLYPDDASDVTTLQQQADRAMYRVKQSGKNDVGFFSPELDALTETHR